MRELYQVVEVGPAWYQENIPCQEACPVKTNCRGYLNLAAAGEFEKGWELALDPNPMASICGSVCAAPCETACRRKEVDKPLSIRYVKKFLSDWTHQNVTVDGRAYTQPPAPVFGPPRGTVAVVGAGCAGLSAASDLSKLGFGVTVYDALDQAGARPSRAYRRSVCRARSSTATSPASSTRTSTFAFRPSSVETSRCASCTTSTTPC